MRYLTFYVTPDNRIDIYNSMTGKETIYHNGNKVSERRTFWGHDHEFSVTEGLDLVQYRVAVSIKMPLRIGFDIFRNGKALLLS